MASPTELEHGFAAGKHAAAGVKIDDEHLRRITDAVVEAAEAGRRAEGHPAGVVTAPSEPAAEPAPRKTKAMAQRAHTHVRRSPRHKRAA